MRKLGLVLAAVLLALAALPASAAAAGNTSRQGTRSAQLTVHCSWDSAAQLYDIEWTISTDASTRMAGSLSSLFRIWAAASAKASAPAVEIAQHAFYSSDTAFSRYDVWGPQSPAGYTTVQGIIETESGNEVVASGTGKCQRGDLGTNP